MCQRTVSHLAIPAIEYTNCISAKRVRTLPIECPSYGIKESDDEAQALRNAEYLFIAVAPRFTLSLWGSTG